MKKFILYFIICCVASFVAFYMFKNSKQNTQRIENIQKAKTFNENKNNIQNEDFYFDRVLITEMYKLQEEGTVIKLALDWKLKGIDRSYVNKLNFYKTVEIKHEMEEYKLLKTNDATAYFSNLKFSKLHLYGNDGQYIDEVELKYCAVHTWDPIFDFLAFAIYKPKNQNSKKLKYEDMYVSNVKFENIIFQKTLNQTCDMKSNIQKIVKQKPNKSKFDTKYKSISLANNICYALYSPNLNHYDGDVNSYVYLKENDKIENIFSFDKSVNDNHALVDFRISNMFLNNKPIILLTLHEFEADGNLHG